MTDPGLRRLALRTLLGAFPGTVLPGWAAQLAIDGLAGYVLFGFNIADRKQVRDLVATAREVEPGIIVSIDEEGGDVTRLGHAEGSPYPGNAALGKVDDPDLTRRTYHAIGTDLASLGIRLNCAPTVDVNTADDNPIIGTRSFGADPHRVAAHAAAAVAGLRAAGVAACAKHFPGHGATEVDSHEVLPTVDAPLSLLRERDLPPFAAAIAAGSQAVMTAHIRVPALTGDEPATFSRQALVDLLRGEMGFTGAVITDALEMRGASGAIGIPEAAVRALLAGNDLLCIGAQVNAALIEATAAAVADAMRTGRLPTTRVEEAAARGAALASAAAPAGLGDLVATVDPELGIGAARQALHVEGVLPALRSPLVVQIDSPATIAVGEVPWGIAPHLTAASNTAEVVRIAANGDSSELDALAAKARDREIVVVTRDTHRHGWARALVEALVTRHPSVVVVEMGWPATWRPAGARAFVATYGAGRANAQAAAEALLGAR